MRKKAIYKAGSALLAAAMIVCSAVTPGWTVHAATVPRDVTNHWARTYIEKAIDAKIVSGYTNGEFRPDNPVTRAEFSHMINAALGNNATSTLTFGDTSRGDWYYNDVAKAVAAGYVSGYSDNTFGPNKSITRQEAAVMLSYIVPVAGSSASLTRYPDYSSVESWSRTAMEFVVGKGYIGTYSDGGIHPQDTMTRAQAATIITKLLEKETIIKTDPNVTRDGTRLTSAIYSNGVTIARSLNDGDVTLNRCVVLGSLNVQGGDTVTLSDCRVANAIVQRSADPVRVIATGQTSVKALTASNEATLETSGLTGNSTYGGGFLSVGADRNSDLTLKGSFPKVTANGSAAQIELTSGRIDELNVSSSAKDAKITVSSGANVAVANVSAPSSFHGSGAITRMYVNSNDVTYEKRPSTVTVGSGVRSPEEDEDLAITPDPKDGAKDVAVDKKITLTFSSAMKLYDGGTIRNSDITDFVQLRKKTSSGTRVEFSASINSSKKIITITPESDLDTDTKYYIIIAKNKLEDADGNGNDAFSSSFTTGDDFDDYVSFTPKDGATGVSVSSNLTVRFSEKMINYDKSNITNSDLSDIITLRKTNSSGTKVPFKATIDSAKKVITIEPSSDLERGVKYYLAVNSKSLRTAEDETAVPGSSITFTTVTGAVTPTASLTLTANENSITVSGSGNLAGTIYAVLLPSGAANPTAAQIIAGKDASGNAVSLIKTTVSANATKVIGTFTGLKQSTSYKVCAVLDPTDSAYANSAVVEKSSSTSAAKVPDAALSALTVNYGGKDYPVSLKSGTTEYTVEVPSGTTEVTVSASTAGGRTQIGNSAMVENTASEVVTISGAQASVTVLSTKSGANDTKYTLNIKVKGNTDLTSVTVDGTPLSSSGTSYSYEIPADVNTVTFEITAADSNAVISANNKNGVGSLTLAINQPATVTIAVTSNSDSKNYTLTITKAAAPDPEPEPEPEPEPDPNPTPGGDGESGENGGDNSSGSTQQP